MRLAVVARRLGMDGGTERFGWGFLRHMVALGHEVHVFAAAGDPPPGVHHHPLALRARGRIGKLLAFRAAALEVPSHDHDLVLSLARTARHDVYRAGGGCHAAWVRAGGWSLADAIETSADRRAVEAARVVVVNSLMAGLDLQNHYGTAAERIRLVRNGVDLLRFAPRDVPCPVPTPAVAFLGSGFARKGLAAAVRALARVPGIHLAVLGHDRHPARYVGLARRHGVERRVHLLGPTPTPELVLPAFSAMILPTRYDSFANACLEALACGVPVVTTRLNGAAEVLPESWMAIDDPEDDGALAAALERVLQSQGLAERCRSVAEAHPASTAFDQLDLLCQELAR